MYVRGAEPGDALTISIEEIRLRPPGLAKIVPSGGILAGEVRAPVLHFVDVERDVVVFPPELDQTVVAARELAARLAEPSPSSS